jgi:hypothetical protein
MSSCFNLWLDCMLQGADSDTAIHLAALYGHTECVRLLLQRGARADVADADGALPLHDAAAGGYLDICTLLLDAAPLTIDRGDSEGDTALHNAARGRCEEAGQLGGVGLPQARRSGLLLVLPGILAAGWCLPPLLFHISSLLCPPAIGPPAAMRRWCSCCWIAAPT